MRKIISNLLALSLAGIPITIASCATQQVGQSEKLVAYLSENYQSPENYIVSCFEDHDIVFVGEYHRIKHDAQLIQHLIPHLYEAGVYNVGIEFANFIDQPLIDQLITADNYDDSLANEIQFRQWPFWGFQEYVDIYKAAWELNQKIPEGSQTIRILGLNGRSDWSYVWSPEDRRNPEVLKKVWPDGDSDECMARIISEECIAKGEKALIYSGINHAYTKYKQPLYDFENDSLIRLNNRRMGNRVYSEIGDRAMTIFLHSPWTSASGYSESVRPADGAICGLISRLNPDSMRYGFDVAGTPFASLTGSTSYWQYGYPGFTLEDYCDGYIIQMPLSEYEGCTVIEDFINESNRLAAISQGANPATKDSSRTVESIMDALRNDTDFKRRFSQFAE
ncbi:MAG: ChaN family lipoprotein [bacterium]|nr:ChaN family lipoprotein [bacterium]